ncbi:UNVERIFIED_CONTAM: hypothetical protein GTU68_002412, partial [Idotea baltica]|nr:hypothetical protein [Idotea baltica]
MSSNLDIPSIIIIGLHGKNGSDIIQGIKNETLPHLEDSNSLQKYKWYIDNKYYQAEVELYNIKNYNNVSSSILNSSEALIVYIDSSKALALTDVDDVLNGLEDLPVEVKLLVCDGFTHEEDVLSKGKALEWCIEGGWELVELSVEPAGSEHEDDLEDDFVDSWGYTRIRQALNAHTWSNLKLKDKEDGGIGQLLKQATLHDDNAQKEVPYDRLEGDRNGSQRDVCKLMFAPSTSHNCGNDLSRLTASQPLQQDLLF